MPDVAIIGDGVIGLSTALELARNGASVRVFGASNPGVASEAAAGLLAPSIGDLPHAVRPFFNASLALYPGLVARLQAHDPDLGLVQGLLEIPPGSSSELPHADSRLLTSAEVAKAEPSVHAPDGAMFHPREGAIDN